MDPSFYELGYLDPHTSRAMKIGDDHASFQGTATPLPPRPMSAASGGKAVDHGRALRDLQDYASCYIDSNSQEPSRMKNPTGDSNIFLQVASTSKRPVETEADGMIIPDFCCFSVDWLPLQPLVRQNEGGWKHPRSKQDLVQEKSELGVQNLFSPILRRESLSPENHALSPSQGRSLLSSHLSNLPVNRLDRGKGPGEAKHRLGLGAT